MKADLAIPAKDLIGEGPAWDAANRRLLWSDLEAGIIHEAQQEHPGVWRETRRLTLGRSLAAVIPRARGGFVGVCGTEILLIDEAGHAASLVQLDVDPKSVRLNDGKCDPQGRLWVGTLAFNFGAGAALYRIDPDGRVQTVLQDLAIVNGMDWSPDGSTYYFTESVSRRIEAFDFDTARGTLSRRRTVAEIGYGEGGPNGLSVDAEGCIWVAVTGAGEVRRYSPDGRLLQRVSISTPGATCCAFAGEDAGDLIITSLGRRMPDVAKTRLGLTDAMMTNDHPESGGLFVFRPGVTGRPTTAFAG